MKFRFIFVIFQLTQILVNASSAFASQTASLAANGETIVNASYPTADIRVVIKAHQEKIEKPVDKDRRFIPSACMYSSSCVFIDKIQIYVDKKQIFIPNSLVCNLGNVHTATVRSSEGKMVLLLDQGDASESSFIRIEFDKQRVRKMNIYTDSSMTQNV